jgi:hypothetical protein
MRSIFPILLTLLLVSCSSIPPPVHQGYERFVPIAQNQKSTEPTDINVVYLALDTKTGQVCRTWDWGVSEKLPGAGFPTCISLYKMFPEKGEEPSQSKPSDSKP